MPRFVAGASGKRECGLILETERWYHMRGANHFRGLIRRAQNSRCHSASSYPLELGNTQRAAFTRFSSAC